MFDFEISVLLPIRKLVRFAYLLEVGKRNTLFKGLISVHGYPHEGTAEALLASYKNASLGVELRSKWCYANISNYTTFSTTLFIYFFFINLFIYLFLAALGLCC